MEKLEAGQLKQLSLSLASKVETVNGIPFLGSQVDIGSADALKKLAFDLKGKAQGAAIVLVAAVDGKASVVIQLDESLVQKGLDAGALIKQKVAPLIKGGGGGQKTLATAGGQDISALHQVIQAVKEAL